MLRLAIVASAAIPATMWAMWPTAPQPPLAKTVVTEGVREQRQDTGTFRARWREMPPATIIRDIGEGAAFSGSGAGPSRVARANTEIEGRTVPSPMPRRTKRVSLRGDICARHGMHRVNYGRRWRCRR